MHRPFRHVLQLTYRVIVSLALLGLVQPATAADRFDSFNVAFPDAAPREATPTPRPEVRTPPDELSHFPSGGSTAGFLQPQARIQALPDLNVQFIGRTPRYRWDQAKKWPNVGETVTFEGHIANRGSIANGSFGYAWFVDGIQQASGTHLGLAAGQEATLAYTWAWQTGPHTVKLVLDPAGTIGEVSEQNNSVEDRTNGLALGIWVEQSFYDFFNQNVWQAGWGGNSFDDWMQRHVKIWNDMLAAAQYPIIAPNGILDRIRLDKVVRVPNGGVNCQTNIPVLDYETDLIWGFPSEMVGVPSPANCSWFTPGYRDNQATWDRDMGLLHEISHARYLIDLYGFNINSHEQQLATSVNASAKTLTLDYAPDVIEFQPPTYFIVGGEIIYCIGRSSNTFTNCTRGVQGTLARSHTSGATVFADQMRIQDGEGNALAGSSALPTIGGAFHWGMDEGFDIMNGGENYGEYSAYSWNRIAGQRPICGNYNAPCNLGEFLQELPQSNLVEIRDTNGNIIPDALVEIYRAKPYPIWYGKTYEGAPDMILLTNSQGRAGLGPAPFGSGGVIHTYGHSNGVLALLIKAGNKVGVQFLEVTAFNLAYGHGNQQQAVYPVVFANWKTVSMPVVINKLYLPLINR